MSTPQERPRFPFARPDVPRPESWLPWLETAYEQRWFSNNGPLVRQLEAGIAARDAAAGREAVTVASATAGLVAVLLALGVRGPVAVPAFTFPATAHAVALAGCAPVLCDVDRATWELSPQAAADAVRDRGCVAIVHVRAFGLCRDLGPIEQVARDAGVPLVVDSAAAFGGSLADGTPVGRAGDAEVFSFHATKVFAAGEGGAVVCGPALASEIRRTANFALCGREVTGPGLNAKMSELTAAVALAMLDRLDDHVERRRAFAGDLLDACTAAGLPCERPVAAGRPPWQGLPLALPCAEARSRVLDRLAAAGVEARPYYAPGLHRTRAFAGCASGPLPATDDLSDRVLCLPVYSTLQPGERELLMGAVSDAFVAAPDALSRR